MVRSAIGIVGFMGMWVGFLIGGFSLGTPQAFAEAKVFSGSGDGSTWHDAKNWSPEGIPKLTDTVTVDLAEANVNILESFSAQSITVGGKATSTLTAESFAFGEVVPPQAEDPAIHLRKGGTVVLKGGGTVTVGGAFKNTEEITPSEPSVLILLE